MLTTAEVAFAQKLLARGEKQYRNWAVVRWVVIVVGIGILIGGFAMVRMAQQYPDEPVNIHPATRVAAPMPGADQQSEITRNELISFAMNNSLLTSIGVGLMAAGAVAFGFAITHWNVHLRDALLCKAIREKFHDDLIAA